MRASLPAGPYALTADLWSSANVPGHLLSVTFHSVQDGERRVFSLGPVRVDSPSVDYSVVTAEVKNLLDRYERGSCLRFFASLSLLIAAQIETSFRLFAFFHPLQMQFVLGQPALRCD